MTETTSPEPRDQRAEGAQGSVRHDPSSTVGDSRPVVRTASDRAMLRATVLALVVGLLLSGAVIAVAAIGFDSRAVLGAVVGTMLTVVVALPTVLTAWAAPRLGPAGMAGAMFGGWGLKMVVVVVVIIALRDVQAVALGWVGIALLAGALSAVTLEMVLLARLRRPLDVTPDTPGSEDRGRSAGA